jgi:hypothetical protein
MAAPPEDVAALVLLAVAAATFAASRAWLRATPWLLFPKRLALQQDIAARRRENLALDSPATLVAHSKGERAILKLEKELDGPVAAFYRAKGWSYAWMPTWMALIIQFGVLVPLVALAIVAERGSGVDGVTWGSDFVMVPQVLTTAPAATLGGALARLPGAPRSLAAPVWYLLCHVACRFVHNTAQA